MTGVGARESLGEFRNDSGSQRTQADDRGQTPPHVTGNAGGDGTFRGKTVVVEQQVTDSKRNNDGNDRGNPHEGGQRAFKVEVVGFLVFDFGNKIIDAVRNQRGENHQDTHSENPDDKQGLQFHGGDGKDDEGDEGYAGHAVSLETVGGGSDAVTGIVARAVSDDTRITRVILPNLEDHLHQVGTDIGNLGEDTASNTQCTGTQRFTDGEADETGSGTFSGDEQQNHQHQQQLNGDEQQTDAHT